MLPSADFVAALPDRSLSLTALLAERARRTPQAPALFEVTFAQGKPQSAACSYAALMSATSRAAAALKRAGVQAGDRVLLTLCRPAAFLAQLLGAHCAGAVPVPLPALADLPLPAYRERIAAVARDAQPAACVVDDEHAAEALRAILPSAVRVLCAAAFESSDAPLERELDAQRPPHELCFLQYTSGSTGTPKGVAVRHDNVVANIRAILEHARVDAGDSFFSWLPVFHDMGLIGGLLMGVYAGLPTFVAAPKTFVTRPDSWLRAISGLRATISFGPSFAYDLLARRLPERALENLDLSCWRIAFNGAEPVVAQTVRAFAQRFERYGLRADAMRPAYGLAECTLAVAFAAGGASPRIDRIDRSALIERGLAAPAGDDAMSAMELTSVGAVLPLHGARIIDPSSGRALPERHVGEVEVSGPSVTPGYYGACELTAAPRTLRTGDLGYLADGELFIVDRLKDMLIVAGRKYAPSDIERVVGTLDGIRPGAVVAFSRPSEHGTAELCIAAALELRDAHDKSLLEERIVRAVYERFALTAARVLLVRPQDLPKTSSGKLRRSACLQLL